MILCLTNVVLTAQHLAQGNMYHHFAVEREWCPHKFGFSLLSVLSLLSLFREWEAMAT